MITQSSAQRLLEAARRAVDDLCGTEGTHWQIAQLTLREAIKAAERDLAQVEVKHITGAKAAALKAAREVDRKAQRVTDHRFLEQNGG